MSSSNFVLSDVAMAIVTWRRSQSWAAEQLGIDEPKLTKIIQQKLSVNSVDRHTLQVFLTDHPGLDLLGPRSARRAALISATDEGLLELAEMAEAALLAVESDAKRWTLHRVAGKARLSYGASYEFDEAAQTGSLALSEAEAEKAEKHVSALRGLNSVFSAAAWPTVKRGIELNLCAIDMLREKSGGRIEATSPARTRYEALLGDLIQANKASEWGPVSKDADIGEIEVTVRLLIVSCGAAIAELEIEAGQPASAKAVFMRTVEELGPQYESLLRVIFIDDAWAHNQTALRNALAR